MTVGVENLVDRRDVLIKSIDTLLANPGETWEAEFEKLTADVKSVDKLILAKGKADELKKEAPELPALKTLPTYSGGSGGEKSGDAALYEAIKAAPLVHFVNAMTRKNIDAAQMVYKAYGSEKDLTINQSPLGAWALPPAVSSQIIDVLRNALVFDKLGVQYWPIPDQQLIVPKQLTDAEAYWVADNQAITASDFTGGELTLVLKYLGAAMKVSNMLLNSSVGPIINQRIQDTLVSKIRRTMEYAYLFGVGAVPSGANNSGGQPRGLLNIPNIHTMWVGAETDGATNKKANGGKPTLTDFSRAMNLVERSDIPNTGTRAWVAHEGIRGVLREMADLEGRQYFVENVSRDGGSTDMLYGYPIRYTNAIPTNVTTGANADTSYMFFGDWQHFMNGMSTDVELGASTETGDAFLKRQTVIRAFSGCECNVEQAEAFVVLKGIRFDNDEEAA
jgi:HK97 family phage major capsid protein